VCCPSATLAVWTTAWLGGGAAPDDVLDALQVWGQAHEVYAADPACEHDLGLPPAGSAPATPVQLLAALRSVGAAEARLVLPAPGDVRGLGGGGPFTKAALGAGEAVVLPDAGFGVVPEPIAEGLLRWHVFALPAPVTLEHDGLGDAEHGLTDAVRAGAGALQALDVARERPGVREELAARLRGAPAPSWPAGMPGRALRVLQRAEEIGTILALAHADEPGGAVSASGANRRAEALRPLVDAVRTARRAAVNEAARVLGERTVRDR
jgi:hypothetical protein